MTSEVLAQPQTPRRFFEKAMEDSKQNAPFVAALSFNQDEAGAYNFLKGYIEMLSENVTIAGAATTVAQRSIEEAASYYTFKYDKDSLSPSEQYNLVLGVWPGIFDAVQIEQKARQALAHPPEADMSSS